MIRTLILDRVDILQKLRIMLFGGIDQLCASCRSWKDRRCRWETCPRECTIVGRICSTVDLLLMNRLIGIKEVLLRQSIGHRTPLEGTPKVESSVPDDLFVICVEPSDTCRMHHKCSRFPLKQNVERFPNHKATPCPKTSPMAPFYSNPRWQEVFS